MWKEPKMYVFYCWGNDYEKNNEYWKSQKAMNELIMKRAMNVKRAIEYMNKVIWDEYSTVLEIDQPPRTKTSVFVKV